MVQRFHYIRGVTITDSATFGVTVEKDGEIQLGGKIYYTYLTSEATEDESAHVGIDINTFDTGDSGSQNPETSAYNFSFSYLAAHE